MELQTNENNKEIVTLENEIDDLSNKLKKVKIENGKIEKENKIILEDRKKNESLRIRILESQEQLIKSQIKQIKSNPVDPSKQSNYITTTEIELVTCLNQYEEYQSHLEQLLQESIKELSNENRLYEHSNVIAKQLGNTETKLFKNKEDVTKKIKHLEKKYDFQTDVLVDFLKSNSQSLYPKDVEASSRGQILGYVLESLLNIWLLQPEEYISIIDLSRNFFYKTTTSKGVVESSVDIEPEIKVLLDCGIIEPHTNDNDLIRIIQM